MADLWRPPTVELAYRSLLSAVAGAHEDIGDAVLTSHWPLVGNANPKIVVVGQAVYGWVPSWRPAALVVPDALDRVLTETQSVFYERSDPMDWIAENRVRSSPFWRTIRTTTEALFPDRAAPWYSHIAWTNLYPVAPNDVRGNPEGPLRAVQDDPAARLLDAVVDAIDPVGVFVVAGPFWWSFSGRLPLDDRREVPRPLIAAGRRKERPWVVGMHPAGAQRRGTSSSAYASQLAATVSSLARPP